MGSESDHILRKNKEMSYRNSYKNYIEPIIDNTNVGNKKEIYLHGI